METGESNNTGNQWCSTTISKDSSWYSQFRNASNPWMARYVYGFIFLVANLLAWAARDELPSLTTLTELKGKIADCFNPSTHQLSHPINRLVPYGIRVEL